MVRALWFALRIVLIVGFVVVAFGGIVPTGPRASPYYSTLSSLAVSTAEACPCNFKDCPGPSGPCVPVGEAIGCCVQGGVCKRLPCF